MDISPHRYFTERTFHPISKVALIDAYIIMHGEQLGAIDSTINKIKCK